MACTDIHQGRKKPLGVEKDLSNLNFKGGVDTLLRVFVLKISLTSVSIRFSFTVYLLIGSEKSLVDGNLKPSREIAT